MTRRIKIVHVITRLIVGGAQENTLLSCALLDRARFESVLITGPQTGAEGELFTEARARGVRVVVLPELVRQVSARLDALALVRLRAILRAEEPDVVHTHSSKAGVLGRLAARTSGVSPAVVHTVHGWSFHDHMSSAVRHSWIALERLAARWCDRLVVVTEQDLEKGLAARIGARSKYVTIRSGMELEPFLCGGSAEREAARSEWGIPPDVPVVGTVMRLSPQKDPLALVEIARRLASMSAAHFVVVGDGGMRVEMATAVRESGLESRFHFTGLRRDVAALVKGFDIFVLTSLWEGLPKVVVQAMAARIPVVATATDGVKEIVKHGTTGLLVPPREYRAAAEAVARLLHEPDTARSLVEAAARVVPSFSAERMVRQLEDLYEQLTVRRKG